MPVQNLQSDVRLGRQGVLRDVVDALLEDQVDLLPKCGVQLEVARSVAGRPADLHIPGRKDLGGEAPHPLVEIAEVIFVRLDRPYDRRLNPATRARACRCVRSAHRICLRRRAYERLHLEWRFVKGWSRCRRVDSGSTHANTYDLEAESRCSAGAYWDNQPPILRISSGSSRLAADASPGGYGVISPWPSKTQPHPKRDWRTALLKHG
jgi:hypothetical protein